MQRIKFAHISNCCHYRKYIFEPDMDRKVIIMGAAIMLASCGGQKWHEEPQDSYIRIVQKGGPTLGYSPESGIGIITKNGYAFKDLNRNGQLDRYEDWRLDIEERIADLAGQISLEEIAGLMLYSSHQAVPTAEITNAQKQFLSEDNLRHVLVTTVGSPEIAARWNNNVQAFVEGLGHGIPANNSSDPRHGSVSDSEFNAGAGGDISMWPNEIGMGATFSPELMYEFGKIASTEYRALGFTTALSPQADLGTDPRWFRFSGTYSEDPKLVSDLVQAYCDGFQTSTGADALYGAWGMNSVNAMVKHWPGGGPGEAGRDAHFGRGKFAVYPNNNLDKQKYPFIHGAFNLKDGTAQASAVMPYYTISLGQSDEMVANNYSKDLLTRQLREEVGYDGVLCTDWMVTHDYTHPGIHSGKPYGVENLTVAQRHLKVLLAGADQFGGNNDKKPILEAFQMMADSLGQEFMQERVRTSARRLLRNIFRTGLFENPYLDPAKSAEIVGNPEFMAKGFEAQVKSIVMVKNHGATLPIKGTPKVYIPQRLNPAQNSFWGGITRETIITPVKKEQAEKYFTISNDPDDSDIAIVFIDSPVNGYGHSLNESMGKNAPANIDNYFIPNGSHVSAPGNGYYPISLQYEDYVATYAREESIGQGDIYEPIPNRSYKGKGVRTFNRTDLELVREMKRKVGKVIVVLNASNPTVMSEIEPLADAILVTFSIQKQAILEVIKGIHEPSGLLPFQMPANMKTVELQAEDTPRDMECYQDSDGNIYDFAFGLNWSGTIDDERVKRYR